MRKVLSLRLRGETHLLGIRTWYMGVLNVTPDSFYDGGLYADPERAVERGLELAGQGADIIDIGGESTRPGSRSVSAQEEIHRVLPVLKALRKRTKAFLSIDTTKALVALEAVDAGADIINDISASRFDENILSVASGGGAAMVLMHMQGTPQTMQDAPFYTDTVGEVKDFLAKRLAAALKAGLKKDRILLDPGIGFGKRLRDNLVLLNNLAALDELGCPILIGPSRKSFIGKILDLPPEGRLEGTIASAVLAVAHGAHILRVHDVEAVRRAVRVAEAILGEEAKTGGLEEPRGYVS